MSGVLPDAVVEYARLVEDDELVDDVLVSMVSCTMAEVLGADLSRIHSRTVLNAPDGEGSES